MIGLCVCVRTCTRASLCVHACKCTINNMHVCIVHLCTVVCCVHVNMYCNFQSVNMHMLHK